MIFPFKPSIFLWFSHDFHYKWAIFHGELLVITRWFPLKGPGGILNGCSSCSKIRRSRDFLVTARIVRAPGPNHLAPGHGWILKKSHKHFTWIAIPDKVNYLSFISIAIFNSYVTNYQRFFLDHFFWLNILIPDPTAPKLHESPGIPMNKFSVHRRGRSASSFLGIWNLAT